MSCDHRLIESHVYDLVDGTLAPPLRRRCEEALAACPHCQDIHARVRELHTLSVNWRDQEPPPWHRVRFAVRPPLRPVPWLGWSALAMSCLAIFLVVMQLEVSTNNGLTMSFGGSQSEARLQALLEQRMEDWRAEQAILLQAELADLAQQQASANRLARADWLERSRQERRQDLDFIFSAWESQRYQDQRVLNQRLDSLATNQIESNEYLNDLLRTVQIP